MAWALREALASHKPHPMEVRWWTRYFMAVRRGKTSSLELGKAPITQRCLSLTTYTRLQSNKLQWCFCLILGEVGSTWAVHTRGGKCSKKLLQKVSVFHNVKFHNILLTNYPGSSDSQDHIHVQPSHNDKHGCEIPGRFDTALEASNLITKYGDIWDEILSWNLSEVSLSP